MLGSGRLAHLVALLRRALGMHAGDSLQAPLDLSHPFVEVLGERDALLEVSVGLLRSIGQMQQVGAQLGMLPEQASTLSSQRGCLLQTSLGAAGVRKALADRAVHLLEAAVDALGDLQGTLLQRLAPREGPLESGARLVLAGSAAMLHELQGSRGLHAVV